MWYIDLYVLIYLHAWELRLSWQNFSATVPNEEVLHTVKVIASMKSYEYTLTSCVRVTRYSPYQRDTCNIKEGYQPPSNKMMLPLLHMLRERSRKFGSLTFAFFALDCSSRSAYVQDAILILSLNLAYHCCDSVLSKRRPMLLGITCGDNSGIQSGGARYSRHILE